ncbi:uncharacterized protein LOC132273195 [Cornus florida]|uniref:uncharacterized protein LOC132273195 n=1 Tax=Cornus florida TaxID=4283 RepID=UPI002898A7BF|nr:uncharacterized protein LOC132273195 [Cornus florida]
MARGLIRHKVGSGLSTSLWLDSWLPNDPISDQLGLTELKTLQLNYQVKVDNLISNSQWAIPSFLHHVPFFQSQSFMSQLQSTVDPTPMPDLIQWLPSAPMDYSHKLTMEYFTPPPLSFAWHHLIWFKYHIPKHSHIVWMAIRNRLYTLDSKPMKHKHKTNACFLCLSDWESLDHLFFKCKYSCVIWDFIQNVAGFYIMPGCWSDLIDRCAKAWNQGNFISHGQATPISSNILHLAGKKLKGF